jgi:hypothetical protein
LGFKFITFLPKLAVQKCVLYLAFFGLAAVLATFQKIGQYFSKSSGHPGYRLYKYGMALS